MTDKAIKTLPKGLLFFIDFSIMLLGATLVALPYVFRMLPVSILSIHFFGDSYQSSLIFFMVCAALFIGIINEVRKILKTIVKKTVFEKEVVKYFNRIAYLCYVLAAVFVFKTIIDFSMPTPLMALTFIFLGLFTHVLMHLFNKAVQEKTDLDA